MKASSDFILFPSYTLHADTYHYTARSQAVKQNYFRKKLHHREIK